MDNTEIITNKASKKKIYVFAGIALAVILLAVIGIVAYSNAPAVRLQKRLDLGNRYLSEMEYDKALAEYRAAIEIDPKNAEAYLGVVEVYIRTNDFEQALAEAQTGYEATNDERLKEKIDMIESGNIFASNGWVMRQTGYDENGEIIKETGYKEDGDIEKYYLYFYNDFGNREKQEFYMGSGEKIWR